ncbi:Portal protein [Dirofilaria immitis]
MKLSRLKTVQKAIDLEFSRFTPYKVYMEVICKITSLRHRCEHVISSKEAAMYFVSRTKTSSKNSSTIPYFSTVGNNYVARFSFRYSNLNQSCAGIISTDFKFPHFALPWGLLRWML